MAWYLKKTIRSRRAGFRKNIRFKYKLAQKIFSIKNVICRTQMIKNFDKILSALICPFIALREKGQNYFMFILEFFIYHIWSALGNVLLTNNENNSM